MKLYILLFIGIFFFLQTAHVVSAEETGSNSAAQPVSYTLPHPGILPGHMFYSLKTMRDNLMGFLISGSLKKAEFNLLQADKHIQASYLLITGEKKDVGEAEKSFAKGEVYFQDALQKTIDAKKQGLSTSDIANRLTLASQKYQEVMQVIEDGVTDQENEQFKEEKAELEELVKRVKKIER